MNTPGQECEGEKVFVANKLFKINVLQVFLKNIIITCLAAV